MSPGRVLPLGIVITFLGVCMLDVHPHIGSPILLMQQKGVATQTLKQKPVVEGALHAATPATSVATVSPISAPKTEVVKSHWVEPPSEVVCDWGDATLSGTKVGSHNGERPRVAIVSAQYGHKDSIKSLRQLPPGILGVFYTSKKKHQGMVERNATGDYLVVSRPYHEESLSRCRPKPGLNPEGNLSWCHINRTKVAGLMAAKFYKTAAFLLPELEGIVTVLWADSTLMGRKLPTDFADRLERTLTGYDMILQKHSERSTVTAEAHPAGDRAVGTQGWINGLKEAKEAVWSLKARGFKDDEGLFQLDAIIYNATSPSVRRTLISWWYEIQQHSFRDQLTFPYVLQLHKIKYNAICTGWCMIPKLRR